MISACVIFIPIIDNDYIYNGIYDCKNHKS